MRKQATEQTTEQAEAIVNGEDLTGYELAKRVSEAGFPIRAQHVYNLFPQSRRNEAGQVDAEKATKWLAGFLANKA
jgi:hypothetical protein